MATIEGTGGDIIGLIDNTGGSYNAKINQWSAVVEVGVVDVTGFSDNGWRSKKPTIVGMRGSATGTVQTTEGVPIPAALLAATAGLSSAKAVLQLVAKAGCTYGNGTTEQAIVTATRFSRPVAGKMDVTFDFLFTGTITQTWDEVA